MPDYDKATTAETETFQHITMTKEVISMKKLVSILCAAALALSLAGCGAQAADTNTNTDTTAPVVSTV